LSPPPHIISVSRRTDIPAYYADWFRKRLEIGYTHYPNPFTFAPVCVSLKPEDVRAFVFWTRNPKPLFRHLDYIDEHYGKRHYMLFTINGMPEKLEERNPKIDFAIDCVKYLCERYNNEYVIWRFDPVLITSITPAEYIIEKYNEISSKIKDYSVRCIFSFVDLYKKTERNIKKLEKENIKFYSPSVDERINLTKQIKAIADSKNISLFACAEDDLLQADGTLKARCIDPVLVQKICNDGILDYKFRQSRNGCGCIESRDIGYYDSCPHGCIYCYANSDPEKAFENAKEYKEKGFPLDNYIVK
jgi:hypothetical protein